MEWSLIISKDSLEREVAVSNLPGGKDDIRTVHVRAFAILNLWLMTTTDCKIPGK